MDAVNAEGVGGGDGMSPPFYDDAQGGKAKLDYDNLLGAREVTRMMWLREQISWSSSGGLTSPNAEADIPRWDMKSMRTGPQSYSEGPFSARPPPPSYM